MCVCLSSHRSLSAFAIGCLDVFVFLGNIGKDFCPPVSGEFIELAKLYHTHVSLFEPNESITQPRSSQSDICLVKVRHDLRQNQAGQTTSPGLLNTGIRKHTSPPADSVCEGVNMWTPVISENAPFPPRSVSAKQGKHKWAKTLRLYP